jgi:hypothetical protein
MADILEKNTKKLCIQYLLLKFYYWVKSIHGCLEHKVIEKYLFFPQATEQRQLNGDSKAVLSMWEWMGGASPHHFSSVSAKILKNCPKTVWQILADSFFLLLSVRQSASDCLQNFRPPQS